MNNTVYIPLYKHLPTGETRAIPVMTPPEPPYVDGRPVWHLEDLDLAIEVCSDATFTEDCEYLGEYITADVTRCWEEGTYRVAIIEDERNWTFIETDQNCWWTLEE